MEDLNKEYSAIVLGLSVCGLGVIRSLGIHGIKVYGFDYNQKGKDAFFSKYAKANLCPHPIYRPEELSSFLINNFKQQEKKPILFPTSDEFVKFISDYRDKLEEYFLFNISSKEIIDGIIDKRIQYELAEKAEIPIPNTSYPESLQDVQVIRNQIQYPLIIKGRYSFKWREELGGVFKGFKINNEQELCRISKDIFEKKIPIIIQSVIVGPNTNHFKFCAYVNKEGRILAKFTLRKIRQYPVEFGVGTCVESVEYKELEELGIKFFQGINYKGVGSVEFKVDSQDHKLKLMELNPRYWMQNEQATYCGVNFALIQYLDLTSQNVTAQEKFKLGVRWIEPVQDFKSFLKQNRHNKLLVFQWFIFLFQCRVFSTFFWHDLKPFFKSFCFGLKLFKLPWFLSKIIQK